MQNPSVTDPGVAAAQSQETGRYYAVQMFGRPTPKSVQFEVVNKTGCRATATASPVLAEQRQLRVARE